MFSLPKRLKADNTNRINLLKEYVVLDRKLDTPHPMEVDTTYRFINRTMSEVGLDRYSILEVLGVGTTFEIFQNILFPYSLNTAYCLSWILRIDLVSFVVFGECRHRYAVSSLMDTVYWSSEQMPVPSSYTGRFQEPPRTVLHGKCQVSDSIIVYLSVPFDELIGNLKFYEVVPKKDSKDFKIMKEKYKSLALKARKVSSDEEESCLGSDEEYAMAVRDFKKFLRRRGMFVVQPMTTKRTFASEGGKEGKKRSEDASSVVTRITS
ncbi:hypothetical protein Tco_0834805 [Tanacetum coccineum]